MLSLPVYILTHRRECRALLLSETAGCLPIYQTGSAAAEAAKAIAPNPAIVEITSLSQLRQWIDSARCVEVRLSPASHPPGNAPDWAWQGGLSDFLRVVQDDDGEPSSRVV